MTTPAATDTEKKVEDQDTDSEDKTTTDASDDVDDKSSDDSSDSDDQDDAIADRSKDDDKSDDKDDEELTYEEFTLPEGRDVDTELLDNFTTFAKEKKFDQEAAQGLIDLYVEQLEVHEKANMDRWTKLLDDKQSELKKDKDFGGKNFDATLKAANSVVRQYDPQKEARKEMKEYGYGNFPGIVKMLARIAKATAEDRSPDGGGSDTTDDTKKSVGERMWPNLKP